MTITPPRRESAEDRRAAIAASARDLLVEKGFEGLRTRDIAERVGINIATLHYHVPSKQALVALMAQSLRDEFIAQDRAHDRRGLTPLEELRLELADFRENLTDNPRLLMALAELAERSRRDPDVREALAPLRARWLLTFRTILEAGRQSGHFRPDLDPDAAALMVTGALAGFRSFGSGDIAQFDRLALEIERAVVIPSCKENRT